MGKIVVIGDSHSQLFSNNPKLNRGVWVDNSLDIFDVRWLGPVTYWRLCRDLEDFINFKDGKIYIPHPEYRSTTKINLDDDVVISLGEIDIRCNILNHGGDYINIIDNMILKIENFLFKNKDYKIHLLSIIPPIRKDECVSHNNEFPFIGTDLERMNMTLYFNKKLFELSEKYNLGYIDIYNIYSDEFGMLDLKKSDMIVHGLKVIDLEIYIKKYFNL